MMFTYTSPGGRHYVQSIGSVAGNVAYTLTPGTEIRLWLLGLRLQLIADATVATRTIRVKRKTTTGDYQFGMCFGLTGITASETKVLASGPGYLVVVGAFTLLDTAFAGHGPLLLDKDHYLHIDVGAGVAGDTLTGYLELLEVPA